MARPTKRARHGKYLFKRGSMWWIKLRTPGQKPLVKSLGTADELEAAALAAPMIAAHKAAQLAARPRHAMVPLFTAGLHTLPDGRRVMATPTELHYLADDGTAIGLPQPNR